MKLLRTVELARPAPLDAIQPFVEASGAADLSTRLAVTNSEAARASEEKLLYDWTVVRRLLGDRVSTTSLLQILQAACASGVVLT